MKQFTHNPNVLFKNIAIILMLGFPQLSVSADNTETINHSYLKFNAKGELIRPTGYREWIYIGAPLTPNDMNNVKAAFPEFHNVYIDPVSWAF
jgi:hypothetical protein